MIKKQDKSIARANQLGNHQVITARPAIDSAIPVARWRIETIIPGPHRQMPRWGDSGRGLVAAMRGSIP